MSTHHRVPLLDLPNETLEDIFSRPECDPSTRARLLFVNRRISALAKVALYRDPVLHFDVHKRGTKREESLLLALQKNATALARLRSLNLSIDFRDPDLIKTASIKGWIKRFERMASRCVSLRKVTVAFWDRDGSTYEAPLSLAVVLKWFARVPALHHLDLNDVLFDRQFTKPRVALEPFNSVRRLDISGREWGYDSPSGDSAVFAAIADVFPNVRIMKLESPLMSFTPADLDRLRTMQQLRGLDIITEDWEPELCSRIGGALPPKIQAFGMSCENWDEDDDEGRSFDLFFPGITTLDLPALNRTPGATLALATALAHHRFPALSRLVIARMLTKKDSEDQLSDADRKIAFETLRSSLRAARFAKSSKERGHLNYRPAEWEVWRRHFSSLGEETRQGGT